MLRKSETKYRIVADNAYGWEFWLSPEGKFLYSSPSCKRVTGYDAGEFLADPDLLNRIIHPDDRSIFLSHHDKSAAEDEIEFRIMRPDGTHSWIGHMCQPIFDEDGQFLGRRGSNRDVTLWKQTGELLRESEEKFRHIFEQSPIGIGIYNQRGELIDLNEVALKMLGMSNLSEVRGLKLFDSLNISDDQKKRLLKGERIVTEIKYDFEKIKRLNCYKYKTTKSGVGYFAVLITPLLQKPQLPDGYLTHMQDVTDRKQAENALRASEARYRAIVEDQTEFICRWLPNGAITYVNEALCRYIDKNRDELIGFSFMPFIPEEDQQEIKRNLDSISWEKQVFTLEHRVILPTGEIRWHEWTDRAVFDGQRRIIEFQATGRDITERKKAEEELKRTSDELRRSNADLKEFAYVASHDLKEPLFVISSFAKLLAKRYKGRLDTNAENFIAYIVNGAQKMQELIKDLLEYSQVGTKRKAFKPVECSLILSKAISDLQVAIEESGAAVTHDNLPTVMADATQLNSLFQNLIGNAIKFRSAETPRIHISAERNGDEWLFSVRDNGIGINPEFADRIFNVFQRLYTSEEYPGTGIGLAICKKIVELHGGRIWVKSGIGKGSTFYFTVCDTGVTLCALDRRQKHRVKQEIPFDVYHGNGISPQMR